MDPEYSQVEFRQGLGDSPLLTSLGRGLVALMCVCALFNNRVCCYAQPGTGSFQIANLKYDR